MPEIPGDDGLHPEQVAPVATGLRTDKPGDPLTRRSIEDLLDDGPRADSDSGDGEIFEYGSADDE